MNKSKSKSTGKDKTEAEEERRREHEQEQAQESTEDINETPPPDAAEVANASSAKYDMEGGPTAEGAAPQPVKYATPFQFHGSEHVEAGRIYRLAEKEDFLAFRTFADSLDGFTLRHNKDQILTWDKKLPGEPMHVIKVFGVFRDATPREMYDMLQDAVFRETWDTFRVEAFRIVKLNPQNDIGYYAGKSPVTLVANRDFVNQRQWYDTGKEEYIIFNTSVPHARITKDYQKVTNKNKRGTFVRAVSKLTGYLIQPWYNETTGEREGCCMTYVTQSDPCGWIPTALTNYVTTKYAPKTITNIREAMTKFKVWFPAQLASGTYEKDWDDGVTPEWWQDEAAEQAHPIPCHTVEFAQKKWREEREKTAEKEKEKEKKKKK